MEIEPKVDFFIDSYGKEAHRYILETISEALQNDVDEKYNIQIVTTRSETEDVMYFHLRGTWNAYKLFQLPPWHLDPHDPQDQKYKYSLSHYEE